MHLKYIKQVILKILFMLGLCNLKFSLKIPCPPLTKLLPTIQYNTPGTPEPPHPSPQIFFFFLGGQIQYPIVWQSICSLQNDFVFISQVTTPILQPNIFPVHFENGVTRRFSLQRISQTGFQFFPLIIFDQKSVILTK